MELEIAIVTMYQYYMAHKQKLPSNISGQRDFIISQLAQGEEVSSVFRVATEKAIEISSPSWVKVKRASKAPTTKS